MLPRSHVLTDKEQREEQRRKKLHPVSKFPGCKPKYYIFESWIATEREIHTVKPPDTISLTREDAFIYIAPKSIAVGGIYSQTEVEAMVNQLMFLCRMAGSGQHTN
ncbi:hypothetical protein KIN20_013215 [Parelaphostrongylus tenuis]|uniref:Uncharacterized protein n=1 Tax=Parelaphostrongylus tenuis TaxID=148309 RepID=A0AAD5N1U5_PARTN|nr:hypothetical protein KIN20_013215 [Parelaphostrongylus tenuis]